MVGTLLLLLLTIAYHRVVDGHGSGVLDVDAVGVGAEGRRVYGQSLDVHVLAGVELDVELRAVLDAQVSHGEIAAHEEPDQLNPQQEKNASSSARCSVKKPLDLVTHHGAIARSRQCRSMRTLQQQQSLSSFPPQCVSDSEKRSSLRHTL